MKEIEQKIHELENETREPVFARFVLAAKLRTKLLVAKAIKELGAENVEICFDIDEEVYDKQNEEYKQLLVKKEE